MYRSREFTSMPFALVISCAIFLLMYKLITDRPEVAPKEQAPFSIRFGPVEIPPELPDDIRKPPPEPPTLTEPPRTPPIEIPDPTREPPVVDDFDPKGPGLPGPGPGMPVGPASAPSGDVVPLVTVRPIYPRMAAAKNQEGRVLVEFTISELGLVGNPRVIESDPRGVFDRAALRAIQKWKFKPYVVEGQPRERTATQEFQFRLEDAE